MKVTIRKSRNNEWGMVESFSTYKYLCKGSISVVLCVTPEGTLAEPYVLRGEEFIPAKQIDEEMGVDKYIGAKKPFYSLLSSGFIAEIKAGLDYNTGEYLPEKSNYTVYKVVDKDISENTGELHLVRLLETPAKMNELMAELGKQIAATKGVKEAFLRSRM